MTSEPTQKYLKKVDFLRRTSKNTFLSSFLRVSVVPPLKFLKQKIKREVQFNKRKVTHKNEKPRQGSDGKIV